jgi:phosphohistidine phosphatase
MAPTKQLFVLRHAKSSWDDPGLEDHERPLAPRGRRAVKVLAEHFRAEAIDPQLILCSSARRTKETLDGVGLHARTEIEDEPYSASPGQVLERLQRVSDEIGSVMVIGHNPAMQVLVLRLASGTASSELGSSSLADVKRKFPTADVRGRMERAGPGASAAGRVRPPQAVGGGVAGASRPPGWRGGYCLHQCAEASP